MMKLKVVVGWGGNVGELYLYLGLSIRMEDKFICEIWIYLNCLKILIISY